MKAHIDTRERILQATLKLIRQKGFKGATTRAIAQESGVNEVTLFRHFKNKKGIVKAAFDKVSYVPTLSRAIKEKVEWNLAKDLLMFSKLYQQLLNQNRDLIIISLKEGDLFPELEQQIANIPRQLKENLIEYFNTMREKGMMIDTNVEAQAMALIWMNFGFFMSQSNHGTQVTYLTEEEFLKNTIDVFARGLTL
ncbi:TetR/AcrR family transcriptional regulator [Cytobacillus sp. IB215665]|uniref:TetR/AcrR family transcriptional regulator n=1 Tax=Cytobacillus sp. IB215665 TaxID=3097357 RepID=UPI002A0DAD40|nr:TetR/AcrR family transcriptional regulator [Cytobacillus sp. IB215665]MDX8367995.1 TetR/AcrR family transcriptional regulator [Cytobacillus sp. IB215665]